VDIDQLVAVAIRDVDRVFRRRKGDAGDQIAVEHQRDARVDLRTRVLCRELACLVVALREGALAGGDRLLPAVAHLGQALRVRAA